MTVGPPSQRSSTWLFNRGETSAYPKVHSPELAGRKLVGDVRIVKIASSRKMIRTDP